MTSTTLAAAMTASSQTITLASGTLSVDALVAVDSEYVSVVEVFSATAGRVQRGVNGSSAAAHDNGADAIIGTAWEFLTGPATIPPFGQADDLLTAQGPSAVPSYAAAAVGVTVHQATVTLTNNQIKALPTTAVELVAAPGSGLVIVPVSAQCILDTAAGAYVAATGSSWLLMWDTGDYVSAPISVELALESTSITIGSMIGAIGGMPTDANITGTAATIIGYQVSHGDNKALVIKDDYNGVANYTGGNAANSLMVSVAYLLLNVSTGLFE